MLTDNQKLLARNGIVDLLKEAHIQMMQYQNYIHPNWAIIAGDIVRAARRLQQSRANEFMNSQHEAKERNKALSEEKKKEVFERTAKAMDKLDDSSDLQQELYEKAKGMGLKVRSTMKVETLQKKIEEAS